MSPNTLPAQIYYYKQSGKEELEGQGRDVRVKLCLPPKVKMKNELPKLSIR